ncbi:RNA polymerase-associated protein RTF1 homolog [Esox lucius]|uniref:RNA polymerase-associated protein RTF1 homolog n=1 Tax=Esox lucius TaxID=8010 RepID=UPI001476D46F|nr:RNA polymerase-associated protein RTF1 homolog [Esox lucius]
MASKNVPDELIEVVDVEVQQREGQEPPVVTVMEDVDTESFDSGDAASSYTNNENMKMKMLKMKIKALEEERDFLRTTITQLTGQRTSSGPSPSSSVGDNIAKLEDQWDDSSDSSSSDSSSSTDNSIAISVSFTA